MNDNLRDERTEELEGVLDDLSEDIIVDIWNEYCENNGYSDDMIYYVADLDELVTGTASEVLNAIDIEAFNMNDEYMYCTIYGWRSFSYMSEDNPIYISDLACWIYDEEEDCDIDEIEELFERWEEEDEEEDD